MNSNYPYTFFYGKRRRIEYYSYFTQKETGAKKDEMYQFGFKDFFL